MGIRCRVMVRSGMELLRVAKKNKDTDMKDSIIARPQEMGVLNEVGKLH